jgi:hypothetical protein
VENASTHEPPAVTSPRVRALVPNLALAAVSLAAVFAGLEVAARVAERGRGGGKEQDEASRYVEHDPRLGWRKKPGAKVRYRRREYEVEVAVNSQGLRDPERPRDVPGTFRVLALGDSFVEGYTVAVDRTVTQVLERSLKAGGCPVEVLNGGTAAYSTDQEYLFYLAEGVKYSPRVVLLFAYYNDVLWNTASNYFGSPKPLLVASGDGLVLSNDPVPPPYRGRTPPPPPAPPAPARLRSAAFEWVKGRLARGAPRAFNRLAGLGLWERLGGDEPDDQMRVFKRRQQPAIEAAWERTDAILRALAKETRRRGSDFAVVYVPSRMEVSDRDWELTRLAYDMDERAWDRRLVARRFAEIGASAGFPVHDLTADLRAASRGILGEPYFTYDGHWNETGHRVAAASVERFLRGRGWMPACAGPPA